MKRGSRKRATKKFRQIISETTLEPPPRSSTYPGVTLGLTELADHAVGWGLFNFIESSGLEAQMHNSMNYSDSLG